MAAQHEELPVFRSTVGTSFGVVVGYCCFMAFLFAASGMVNKDARGVPASLAFGGVVMLAGGGAAG